MASDAERRVALKQKEREERKASVDKAILALVNDSDRSVALVGAALIDAELALAILRFTFPSQEAERTAQKALGVNGAISSFSAKIDLGVMLGIYGNPVSEDLHTVRKIRNEFAHDLDAHDFSAEKPALLSTRLKHILKFIVKDDIGAQLRQPFPGGGMLVSNLAEGSMSGRAFFLQNVIFLWGALWSAAPLGQHPVLNWKPQPATSR